ncbi:MAG: M1 family metallopeptidase [Saprospiraceae bacterium]|nr:M1 family metallopeptidase [Saprospiraceae bacterium]
MSDRFISTICLALALLSTYLSTAGVPSDKTYWQQEVRYKIEINLDVETNRFSGRQSVKYQNNSPETLEKVFFHLYFNAFQPGSTMDVRARTLADSDPRVGSRISRLTDKEIGYHKILSLTQDGMKVNYEVVGTILEVDLSRPIRPGQSIKFEMEYEAQVPIQVRRSGRDNAEGIRYSMAQWYPKLCEFDTRGWHADPYIAREFYGVWGEFDVSISLDAGYTVAATGELQNAKKIGHGYAPSKDTPHQRNTWHFKAKDVHDFVWAADPDYKHDIYTCADGLLLHSFYQPHETFNGNWEALLPIMEEAFRYINIHFGKYPYPVYSFIQGGDGGMEYPMATLITGHRSLTSLVGVSVHELMHSWYQMVLGFNESYYYWMDEGFTNYAAERVMNHLRSKGLIPGDPDPMPYESFYNGYIALVMSGVEEPLSTHADHFENNGAYGDAAYQKGSLFLHQLEYVIGKPAFDRGLLDFFNTWKFKHPDDNDFIRIMEKTSGLELDWYRDYMVYSLKTVDYAIDTVFGTQAQSAIILERLGAMPMPIDVVIHTKEGTQIFYTIPLDIMRGGKMENGPDDKSYGLLPDWNWVNPYYIFQVPFTPEQIQSVTIDPFFRMLDVDRENNVWHFLKS